MSYGINAGWDFSTHQLNKKKTHVQFYLKNLKKNILQSSRRAWGDNIRIVLKWIRCGVSDWFYYSQNEASLEWRAVLKDKTKFHIPPTACWISCLHEQLFASPEWFSLFELLFITITAKLILTTLCRIFKYTGCNDSLV